MILIETNYENFEAYLKTLSKKAKQQYAYVCKHNNDLEYRAVQFVRGEVEEFMHLWERQLIRGEYKHWAFTVGYLEDLNREGRLQLYAAYLADKKVALHFIQRREGFWECHPPMYDKIFGNKRYLAKFMWFNLIKHAIDEHLPALDMGGGPDNWREMIQRRSEFPNPAYKWIYVPEAIKNNPEKAKDYQIKELTGEKYLHERI